MGDGIRPALTPKEWRKAFAGDPTVNRSPLKILPAWFDKRGAVVVCDAIEYWRPDDCDRLVLAAVCLHEHPQGFTHDDVRFLRARRDYARAIHGAQIAEGFDFDLLAARIEALLPPEGANA